MATILIVDDRPTNRQFLLTLLGYTGHRLLEAADGAEALELARAEHPDTIITDILMPTMNGFELVQQLREDAALAHTPVIVYTATYHTAEARALAESCGVKTLLPKPSEPQDILAAVNDALGAGALPLVPEVTSAPGAAKVRQLHEVGDRLTQYVNDLRSAQLTMDEMLARSLLDEKERVLQISESFADNIENLQRVTTRLSTLLEAGVEMMAEHDPVRLIERFFDTCSKVVASRYAVVGMLDGKGERLDQVLAKGLDPQLYRDGEHDRSFVESLLTASAPVRQQTSGSRESVAGMPPHHPPVRSFLGLSIATRERAYGWVYFADRFGEAAFTDEDERVAAILAAELAVLYENAILYDVVQRHAARLEIEAAERKRAQELLADSEARFRQMAETIRDVFFLTDATGRFLYVSPAYEETWGHSREPLYVNAGAWLDAVHPEDRERVAVGYAARRTTGCFDEEYRIVTADARTRWVHARTFPIFGDDGALYRVAGIAHDITARKQAELRIRRLNRVYAVLSGINGLIVRVARREELFHEACRIAVADGGFALAWIGTVDRQRQEIEPQAWESADPGFVHRLQGLLLAGDGEGSGGIVARAVQEKTARVSNDVAIDPDVPLGREYALRGVRSMAVLPLVSGNRVAGVLTLHSLEPGFFDDEEMTLLRELAGDIAFALDHIEKSERLDYLAYYDALTGLANRNFFQERLTQRLLADAGTGRRLALVLLDVQRFDAISDAFGRQGADQVLKQLARRLQHGARDPSEVARVGTDHFAVLLAEIAPHADLGAMVEQRMDGAFGEPIRIAEDVELRVPAKAGIAIFPADGADAETLFASAEAALREAAESDERCVFYAHRMTERTSGRVALENALRRAIENDEFILYYQPKVDLETRRISGAEALLRWRSPELGLVAPGEFIPLLEETGLILDVGEWVLRRAVSDRRQLLAEGYDVPRIAANVSARQLRQRGFVDLVQETIRDAGSPAGIDIELTESVVMEDVAGNIGKLRALGALGVDVAIDDFGTGYSSLAYLAKLPVQSVKIDRSFIVNMLTDPDTTTLVSTIISLAHSLRLSVVAEGVETEEQARILRLLRCDEMQGYLMSRPVPIEDLTPLLSKAA
jgi:diguanylate cyclase (GGDEF)-like protein/PAS domain S-box-containing protein